MEKRMIHELNKIYQGDSLEVLKSWPDEFVDCVITSPPYYGLRDYGTGQWIGGDSECKHIKSHNLKRDVSGGVGGGRDKGTRGEQPSSSSSVIEYQETCGKCGAEKKDLQIGLEKTPEEYVAKMVQVFREAKRVLKKTGTLWLNLGDSYSNLSMTTQKQQGIGDKRGRVTGDPYGSLVTGNRKTTKGSNLGLKKKDLIGIPWRVAFALQADGWYLRQDIIWAKPNPMPESVTDRCTKSHEYIFLMSKSPKYYFDNEAIKETATGYDGRKDTMMKGSPKYANGFVPGQSAQTVAAKGHERWKKRKNDGTTNGGNGTGFQNHSGYNQLENPYVRNKRSVWTITTKPFREAHFATFPEDLIVPMVKAGSPKEGIILDPFMGAGTTGLVAKKLGRQYLGIELNPEYIKIAEKRINAHTPLL